MRNPTEIRRDNERATARELANDRADAIKVLRHLNRSQGADGVTKLLSDAGVLTPVFDRFADQTRE